MKKSPAFEVAKTVTGAIGGYGIGVVCAVACRSFTPAGANVFHRVSITVGSIGLGSAAGSLVSSSIEKTFDMCRECYLEVKDRIKSTKEEEVYETA